MSMITKEQALAYHSEGRRGKIKVVQTKPTLTAADLSMAYTPGVAEPCRKIAANPEDAFLYTAKGNLVAVGGDDTEVFDGCVGQHLANELDDGCGHSG